MSIATSITRYADHPSAYLALNEGTQHFTSEHRDGAVAYALAGRRYVIQIGGVYAAPSYKAPLVDEFLQFTRGQRRRVVAVQIPREDADIYAARGFKVNQFGASYTLALRGFSLKGTKFIKLRNKIARARRENVRVAELGVDMPYSGLVEKQIDAIDATWLRSKGRHVKELRVLVGDRGPMGSAVHDRRVFVALRDSAVLAYISYRRTYGRNAGWMHDLSRRDPEVVPGVLELCNSTALERFREEGCGLLHFGFTPFVGLDIRNEIAGAYSEVVAWVIRWLGRHGSFVYPSQTQVEYKMKWAPTQIEPDFIAFEGGFSFAALWNLMRVTRAL